MRVGGEPEMCSSESVKWSLTAWVLEHEAESTQNTSIQDHPRITMPATINDSRAGEKRHPHLLSTEDLRWRKYTETDTADPVVKSNPC